MVGCDVGGGIYGRKLMLCGRDLVVFGFCEYAELPEFFVQVRHICGDTRLDRAEIVVVHFLTLGRLCTEQCSAGEHQIFAFFVHLLVDEEVFLFGSDGGADAFDVGVAEETEYAESLFVQRFHGTEQRRLFVKRFAAVGTERGRDAETSCPLINAYDVGSHAV